MSLSDVVLNPTQNNNFLLQRSNPLPLPLPLPHTHIHSHKGSQNDVLDINNSNNSLYLSDQDDVKFDVPNTRNDYNQPLLNNKSEYGYNYTNFPTDLTTDFVNQQNAIDPLVTRLQNQGIVIKKKSKYYTHYINIDSTYRNKKPKYSLSNKQRLTNNPLSFVGQDLKILVTDTEKYNINDKIIIQGLQEKQLTLRSHLTDDFGKTIYYFLMNPGKNYMKINANTYINNVSNFYNNLYSPYPSQNSEIMDPNSQNSEIMDPNSQHYSNYDHRNIDQDFSLQNQNSTLYQNSLYEEDRFIQGSMNSDIYISFDGWTGDTMTEWYFETLNFTWDIKSKYILNDDRISKEEIFIVTITENVYASTSESDSKCEKKDRIRMDMLIAKFEVNSQGIVTAITHDISYHNSNLRWTKPKSSKHTENDESEYLSMKIPSQYFVQTKCILSSKGLYDVPTVPTSFYNVMEYIEKTQNATRPIFCDIMEKTCNYFVLRYKEANDVYKKEIKILFPGTTRTYQLATIGNISVNYLNSKHKMFITLPDVYNIIDQNVFFIKLNTNYVPKKFEFSDLLHTGSIHVTVYEQSKSDVTITYHHSCGIPNNIITSGSGFPLITNSFFKHVKQIVDKKYIIVSLNDISTYLHLQDYHQYDQNFGGPEIIISHVDNYTPGYQNSNNYEIELGKTYTNISKIRMISSTFPKTQHVFMNNPNTFINNRFYWQNLDDGENIYRIDICPGTYTAIELKKELESNIRKVMRVNNKRITNVRNFMTVSIDEKTNKVIFSSFNEYVPETQVYIKQIKLSTINGTSSSRYRSSSSTSSCNKRRGRRSSTCSSNSSSSGYRSKSGSGSSSRSKSGSMFRSRSRSRSGSMSRSRSRSSSSSTYCLYKRTVPMFDTKYKLEKDDLFYKYPLGDFFKNNPNPNLASDLMIIKIYHPSHKLKNGDEIIIQNSYNYKNIHAKYLNGKHKVTNVFENYYDILLDYGVFHHNTKSDNYDQINVNDYIQFCLERDDSIPLVSHGQMKIYTKNTFRIRFDFPDTLGNELGFDNIGEVGSITSYHTVITNEKISRALSLEGPSYLMIKCKQLSNITRIGRNPFDYFYRINLNGKFGNDIYDTFVDAPLLYNESLKSLNKLSFEFITPNGHLYDFNSREHSFVLEILTSQESPDNNNLNIE